MQSREEIETYLQDLDVVLASKFPGEGPIRLLIVGGAYLLLSAATRRPTEDIDVVILELEGVEADTATAETPSTRRFKSAIRAVAKQHGLKKSTWLNDDCAYFLRDMGPLPTAKLWRTFSKLQVYLPAEPGYILALKLMAYREKDKTDISALCAILSIRTRAQAQALVDRYLPSREVQQWHALSQTLDDLFP